MKKYIIIVTLITHGKLVYRVTAENKKNATQKALNELSDTQINALDNFQVIDEIVYAEI